MKRRPKAQKKQKSVWEGLAVELVGNYDGPTVKTKYNNMLQAYRKEKIKALKSGETKVEWPFYDLMDNYLDGKMEVIPNDKVEIGDIEEEKTNIQEIENIMPQKTANKTTNLRSLFGEIEKRP